MSVELELPGVYLDAVIEDVSATLGTGTPFLINQDPEPNETGVPLATLIQLDITTAAAAGTIDLATVKVFVEGVLAFDGSVPEFKPGWNGVFSSFSNPQADTLRVIIDYLALFESEHVVDVRVQAQATGAGGGALPLDTTYIFTCVDVTPPRVVTVEAVDLKRVRITFSEPVTQTDATSSTSALKPANWELERLGDGIVPIVFATVKSVETVNQLSVDLLTDIPLTPGGMYRVYGTNLTDLKGNVIVAPFNQLLFTGWVPPAPEGRLLDLYRMLPLINRQEDEVSLDLKRFIGCLQEVAGLLLYDVDRFIDLLDPDLAPEDWVDLMLCDLGNPFTFDLSEVNKRRLAQVLVDIYRLKGTEVGIEQVILFFLNLVVEVDEFNAGEDTWILGEDELGIDTFLGTSASGLLYSFQVIATQVLTTDQRKQITDIVEYMKPAHTHFVALVEPVVPVVLDHLELGLSELGENWDLH